MNNFPLKRTNYIIMGIAVILICIGFMLMYGSSTIVEFNPDVFSFRRITLAPIIIIFGFLLMIIGIMWKAKNKK